MDPAGGTRRRAGGELEHAVLAVLWRAGRPLTSRDVRRELDGDLAYNTVQTTLVRLYDKGLVRRTPDGRAHRYAPTKQAAELTAERMRDLLAVAADRRSVLLNFVDALDESDERILRDLLGRE